MGYSSAPAARRARAVESFKSAAECIGPITPGFGVFAVTRGQFSMLDAVLHAIESVGVVDRLSLWTWTIADHEIQIFKSRVADGQIKSGTLIIDQATRQTRNIKLIKMWKESFGEDSVRYVSNHAKMATVEGGGMRICLRGSMNLNANPRFEQLDVTEGGADFDLVRSIEEELPILRDDCTKSDALRASRVSDAADQQEMALFQKVKTWKP